MVGAGSATGENENESAYNRRTHGPRLLSDPRSTVIVGPTVPEPVEGRSTTYLRIHRINDVSRKDLSDLAGYRFLGVIA